MLAVGVLVPLSFGRLGKSWRHAAGLKKLATYACLAFGIFLVLVLNSLRQAMRKRHYEHAAVSRILGDTSCS
jgi:hypothetical protein